MLKLATWNVNGIRAREREVLQLLTTEHPDVLCLQEVKASAEHVPDSLAALPDYFCYWHGHKGYSGVALLLSKSAFVARPRFAHPEFDIETRIVTAQAGDLVVASIYVPNGGKDFDTKLRFLDALDRFVRASSANGMRLLLAGDLNVARTPADVHDTLRKPQQIGQTEGERAMLERIIGDELEDLSRRFYPDDAGLFTWWAPWRNMREKNIGWRLDYVLASRSLSERSLSCEVASGFGSSDHAPVVATFDMDVPHQSTPEGGSEPPAAGRGQMTLDFRVFLQPVCYAGIPGLALH